MKYHRPEDLFRAEKERAQTVRNSQHARLLAEAKAAFDKLMAEGQAARKSGRPRKHPLPPLKTSSSRPPVKAPVPAPVAKPAPVRAATPVKAAAPAKPAKASEKVAPKAAPKAASAKKPAAKKAPAKKSRKSR